MGNVGHRFPHIRPLNPVHTVFVPLIIADTDTTSLILIGVFKGLTEFRVIKYVS
jgi:hypothetical protein